MDVLGAMSMLSSISQSGTIIAPAYTNAFTKSLAEGSWVLNITQPWKVAIISAALFAGGTGENTILMRPWTTTSLILPTSHGWTIEAQLANMTFNATHPGGSYGSPGAAAGEVAAIGVYAF